MKKYFLVFTNSLSEFFIYRLNFILWRIRVVITMLITYFLWNAIFFNTNQIFGYSKNQMLTYVLLLTFINGFVLSTQTPQVGDEIRLGYLSRYLIKPINYFLYNFFRDLSDKSINLIFSIVELFLIITILHPPILVQTEIVIIFLFFISIILATLLYFEISLGLSFLGFWLHDTWPTRFLFFILISFLAGNYFPLDILPVPLYNLLIFSPFTYLIFFPIKIYLGQTNMSSIYQGISIMFIWVIFFGLLLQVIWKKGLKAYTSEGQ